MNKQFANFLTEGITNLRISIPLLITSFLQGLSGFTAIMFLAYAGSNILAAAGLVSNFFIMLTTLYWGCISAVSILVAQYAGAKANRSINLALGQGIFLALSIAIPSWLILWGIDHLLFLAKQPLDIIQQASIYLFATNLSLLPLAILFVFEQFLIGLSKTRLVLAINLLQIPLEILLCYLFIFGKWGFPKFGIAGVGYAYAVVFILAGIAIASYLLINKKLAPYIRNYSAFKFNFQCYKELIIIGLPVALMFCIETSSFVVIAFLMARIASAAVADFQITLQFCDISLMLIYAFAQITTVRVGNLVGENNKSHILLVVKVGLCLCLILGILIASAFLLFPTTFIHIDVNQHNLSPEVIANALTFFPILSLFLIIESLRLTIYSALSGLKDTKVPMLISLMTFWGIAILSGSYLAFYTALSAQGLWFGLVIGSFSATLLLIWRFYYQYKTVDLIKILKEI